MDNVSEYELVCAFSAIISNQNANQIALFLDHSVYDRISKNDKVELTTNIIVNSSHWHR